MTGVHVAGLVECVSDFWTLGFEFAVLGVSALDWETPGHGSCPHRRLPWGLCRAKALP